MKAVKVRENIYWVGGIDWDLRNFHGYLTQRGSSYNAYLIIDEKVTLVDSVKSYMTEEMIKRISSVIDPSKIDYIVCNHVEMDHSGAIPAIMDLNPNAKIFTSPNGEKGLKAHYKKEWNFEVVKSGDSISLGKNSIDFVLTPMVHWPDNMISYMPEEKILFSNDAFGQHLATSERFDDEYPTDIIFEEAKKYYANIVLPYSPQVKRALDQALELDIEIIAPSHGVMWKEHIGRIIEDYKKWSSNTTDKKALIIFDTMWSSTKKMAISIQDAFDEKGYSTKLICIEHNHISDIMTEVINAEYVCVGSPTLNNNMLPTVASFLCYLKGLAPKGRKAIAFGSFGWGGQSISMVEKDLKDAKFEIIDVIKQNYIPSKEEQKAIKERVMAKI